METPKKQPTRLKKGALAAELRLSWVTLDKYLRMPGAPLHDVAKTYDLESVRLWCEQQAAGARRGNTTVPMSDFDKLRQQKIKMEIEHSRWEFEKERGEFIQRNEIASTVWALMAESDAMYRQAFEHELPFQYKGKTAVECQQMNIKALDSIAKRFKEGALPLTGKEEPQSA